MLFNPSAQSDAGRQNIASLENSAIHSIDDGFIKLMALQPFHGRAPEIGAKLRALLKTEFAKLEQPFSSNSNV
jgi:hypothetical protein